MDSYDMSPTQILGKLTQKYKKDDFNFSTKIANLENSFETVIVGFESKKLDGEDKQEIERIFN